MRKIYFIAIMLITIPVSVFSQQVPVYSQYIMNEFIINPAVAGLDGMTTINFTGRKQWVNVSHSPETYSASISTRVLKSPFSISKKKFKKGSRGRVGLGAAFSSDNNGAINRTNVQLAYAYHIFLQNYQLSFGLKAYATQFKINPNLIDFHDQSDPILNILGQPSYIPDAGVGASFSTSKLHLGFSANHLLESALIFGDIKPDDSHSKFEYEHIRQYTLYGYYKYLIPNTSWTIEPSVLLRGNEKARMSADISSRIIYQNDYWGGLSFRTSGEFVLLLGLKVNRVYIGYSFDYGVNKLSFESYGSHEVVMAIKLGDGVRRYRWLERY